MSYYGYHSDAYSAVKGLPVDSPPLSELEFCDESGALASECLGCREDAILREQARARRWDRFRDPQDAPDQPDPEEE